MNTNYTGNPIPDSHRNLTKLKLRGEMMRSVLFCEVLMNRLVEATQNCAVLSGLTAGKIRAVCMTPVECVCANVCVTGECAFE